MHLCRYMNYTSCAKGDRRGSRMSCGHEDRRKRNTYLNNNTVCLFANDKQDTHERYFIKYIVRCFVLMCIGKIINEPPLPPVTRLTIYSIDEVSDEILLYSIYYVLFLRRKAPRIAFPRTTPCEIHFNTYPNKLRRHKMILSS